MGEMIRALAGSPKRYSLVGKEPKDRWKDNIQMDL
jgi:hypothetical protein